MSALLLWAVKVVKQDEQGPGFRAEVRKGRSCLCRAAVELDPAWHSFSWSRVMGSWDGGRFRG